jgi:hypothetical protein
MPGPPRTADGLGEFVSRWRRVGPLLETIRNDELYAMAEAERLKMIDALLSLAASNPAPHAIPWGLVEMQRRLRKLGRSADVSDGV